MKKNKQKRFDLANFSATSAPLILLLIFASLLIFETIYGLDPDFNFRSMYDLYKAEAVGSYAFSTNGFESVILLIAAFILGIKQFRFTNKKELGYTTLLFAQKRKSIFNKKVIPVITVLSAVTIFAKLLVFLVNWAHCNFSFELLSKSFVDLLICLTAIFIGFTVSTATSLLTGKLAEAIVSGYALLIFPSAVISLINSIFSALLYGYTEGVARTDVAIEFYSLLNPLGMLSSISYTHYFGEDYFVNTSNTKILCIGALLWICLCIAALSLLKRHFTKNYKAECIGFKTINRKMTFVTSIALSFDVASDILLFSLVEDLSGYLYDGQLYYKPITTILIFVISSIVLGYLINSLLTTSIRFTKEKLKLILAPVSIVAVLALFSVTNGFGYYNRIPDMEKIEYVNVTSSFNFNEFFSTTEANDFEYNNNAARMVLTTENDIKLIRDIHQTALDYRSKDTSEMLCLDYVLKNGDHVYRTYFLASDELSEQVLSLWESEEASRLKKAYYVDNAPTNLFLHMDESVHPYIPIRGSVGTTISGTTVSSEYYEDIYGYDLTKKPISCLRFEDDPVVGIVRKDGTSTTISDGLSKEDFNKLKSAIYADMTQVPAEEWFKPEKSYGIIGFTYPDSYYNTIYGWDDWGDESDESVEEYAEDAYYEWYSHDESIEIAVTSSTPNTVRVLKELGYFDEFAEKADLPKHCYLADLEEITKWYNNEEMSSSLTCHGAYFTTCYSIGETVIWTFDPEYWEEDTTNPLIDRMFDLLFGFSTTTPTTEAPVTKITNEKEMYKLIDEAHQKYYVGRKGKLLIVEYETENYECFVIPEE